MQESNIGKNGYPEEIFDIETRDTVPSIVNINCTHSFSNLPYYFLSSERGKYILMCN